jgi:hypothetical protein
MLFCLPLADLWCDRRLGFPVAGVMSGLSDTFACKMRQMAESAIRKWFKLRLSRYGLQGIIPRISLKQFRKTVLSATVQFE